jgi:hypothetical protein
MIFYLVTQTFFIIYYLIFLQITLPVAIDHGKSDKLGSGPNWKKTARFKRLENFSLLFQNDLAFLGRIGKPSLSEFL